MFGKAGMRFTKFENILLALIMAKVLPTPIPFHHNISEQKVKYAASKLLFEIEEGGECTCTGTKLCME